MAFASTLTKGGYLCIGDSVFWQESKDSNPGHTVLETAVLPTELHSYMWWPRLGLNQRLNDYESPTLTTELRGLASIKEKYSNVLLKWWS